MRTLKLTKSFKDVSIEKVFVYESNETLENIEESLRKALQSAEDKICFVLENGMNDTIAQMLYGTQAGKYLIVPTIEEGKYQRLKGEVIAREVDNINGNYAIIDSKKLFFFDNKFNGYIVQKGKAADVIQQLFIKEFWENGQAEFIESKIPCAEVTFDIPPIYGDDTVLLDESFSGETEVEKLINNAKVLAFTQKTSMQVGEIVIKNAQLNSDLLKTAANTKVFLAQDLPCCLASDGYNTYILNFDIAKYQKLPEKRQGRLFAVKCENLPMGKMYRFFKHRTIEELVGADILTCDEKKLTVFKTAEEQRKIVTDLRMAAEYEKMDAEILETRIVKKYPDIFKTDKYAVSVTYDIEVEIVKRSINSVAKIYGEFEKAKEALRKKWKELSATAKELKLDKKIVKYVTDIDGISDRAAYGVAVSEINEAISLLNNRGDNEVDEALSEVTNKKKKIIIQPVNAVNLNMDIPANGKLYQNKDKYEYVLSSENNLSAAMKEMELAGIENANILYLAE